MRASTAGDVRVYPDLHSLNRTAAEESAGLIQETLQKSARFNLVVAGGNTPRSLYRLLAEDYRDRISWPRIHLFWGDERYLPPEDRLSNYHMVHEELIEKVPLPPENVHPMPTHFSTPEEAARAYESTLREHFPDLQESRPAFDLVLLGMGGDGHTASLFPGSPALQEKTRWVVAVEAAVEPPQRLTLTLPVLNRARNAWFLVSGGGKREVLREILENRERAGQVYPAAMIKPAGRLVWHLDRLAYGRRA